LSGFFNDFSQYATLAPESARLRYVMVSHDNGGVTSSARILSSPARAGSTPIASRRRR
jgi:hypothetical protein